MFIAKYASKLTSVHRRDEFRASKIMFDRARSNENIEFKTPYVPEEFIAGDDGKLRAVRLRHADTGETEEMEVGGAFVAIGHIPRSELVATRSRSTRTATSSPMASPPRRISPACSRLAIWSTTRTARRSPPPAPAAWAPSTPSGICAIRRPRPRPTGTARRARKRRAASPRRPRRCPDSRSAVVADPAHDGLAGAQPHTDVADVVLLVRFVEEAVGRSHVGRVRLEHEAVGALPGGR